MRFSSRRTRARPCAAVSSMTTMPARSVNDESQRATPSRFSRDPALQTSTLRGRLPAGSGDDAMTLPGVHRAGARALNDARCKIRLVALAGERGVDVDRLRAAEQRALREL